MVVCWRVALTAAEVGASCKDTKGALPVAQPGRGRHGRRRAPQLSITEQVTSKASFGSCDVDMGTDMGERCINVQLTFASLNDDKYRLYITPMAGHQGGWDVEYDGVLHISSIYIPSFIYIYDISYGNVINTFSSKVDGKT